MSTAEKAPFGGPPPVSERPDNGTGAAAKAVAQDATELVKAEVALAKAEIQAALRAKATGAGLLGAAGALVAVAFLGLLLAAGFALSEVAGLPGWASALIVSGALIVVALVLALVGRSKMGTALSAEVTKENVNKDVTWVKQRLTTRQ